MKEKVIGQYGRPAGRFGLFIGRTMNRGHRDIRNWSLGKLSIGEDYRILDVGCGGGAGINAMARQACRGKLYGLDHSEDMVELSQKVNRGLVEAGRAEIVQGNVSSLPFEDNAFDLVTSFDSCYFWPDPAGDLREIKRVLKPGGSLLLANQAYRDERSGKRKRWFSGVSGFRINTPDEYRAFLEEAGYSSTTIYTDRDRRYIAALAVNGEAG